MPLIRTTSKLPLARCLALVALLCAAALQLQEAGHGHWHELKDSNSQCLLCKSGGTAALPLDPAPALQLAGSPQAQILAQRLPRAASHPLFLARGPPPFS